ncbi:MAG: hypothetical protein IT423_20660 [Pirellulaceae bacterium]|nr:hypothetical protein [Pirellulaceae bacterium]
MIDTVQDSRLSVLAIDVDIDDAVYAPSLSGLTERLEAVQLGVASRQCVECAVRLMENIEGDLVFIRVSHPQSGQFAGWVVQLSCSDDFNSFALARIDELTPARLEVIRSIQLTSYAEAFDSRCVLSYADILEWISCEMAGSSTCDRFRWIDFSMALKELF